MVYPRACPLCRAAYGASGAIEPRHVTLGSEPGGTPSPWRPEEPGRLLTLRCLLCRGTYPWDYFADAWEVNEAQRRERALAAQARWW